MPGPNLFEQVTEERLLDAERINRHACLPADVRITAKERRPRFVTESSTFRTPVRLTRRLVMTRREAQGSGVFRNYPVLRDM